MANQDKVAPSSSRDLQPIVQQKRAQFGEYRFISSGVVRLESNGRKGQMRAGNSRASVAALLLSVHLFGCSSPPRIHEAQQLTVKQIISDMHIDELFLKEVKPRDVTVGPDRVFSTPEGRNRRGACFRASVGTILNPELRRTVTYVALVDANHLIDRRPATRDDHCEADGFEPVTTLPARQS